MAEFGEGANRSAEKPATNLSLQAKVLGAGMLYDNPHAVTDYKLAPDGSRVTLHDLNPNEFRALVDRFRLDPYGRLKIARENLTGIMRDQKIPESLRKDRVRRYVDTHLDLVLTLDRKAFPPTQPQERVIKGIPDYIPDGLIDMGSEEELDPAKRSREQIQVDKKAIFVTAKPLFYEIFGARLGPEVTEEAWEKYATERVGQYVYTQYPYDIKDRIYATFGGHPVNLSATGEHKLMQCRHHALVTQTLLEGFGIESRLMKNNVTFDRTKNPNLRSHASNSVRIGKKWYLLDSTAPERRPDGKASVFLKEIPENTINLNANTYTWRFQEANGRTRIYQSRSNMHYRIRDNVTNPAGKA